MIENKYQNLLRNETATQQLLSEANTFSNDVMEMVEVSANSPDQESAALKSISSCIDRIETTWTCTKHTKARSKACTTPSKKSWKFFRRIWRAGKKMKYLRGAIHEGRKKLVAKERMVERANRTNFKLNGTVGKLNAKWGHMWGHVVPPLHPFTA